MIIRTNLDYLAYELTDYNHHFSDKVLYQQQMPSEEDLLRYKQKDFLLHPSGARQVLLYEFGQNRDSLQDDLFKRYCTAVVAAVEGVRKFFEPYVTFYNKSSGGNDLEVMAHCHDMFLTIYPYLLAADDLEERVMFYFPDLVKSHIIPDVERKEEANTLRADEWGAIFYYVNAAKLTVGKTQAEKLSNFKIKHGVTTTLSSFKNNKNEAVRRINHTNDFPISKLENIKPFIAEHYRSALELVENDIVFLNTELKEIK